MSERIDALRREHVRLRQLADELCEAARSLPDLKPAERRDVLTHVVGFLNEQVAPHTWIDEHVLYPEVVARLGDPLVTASMNYDHQAIRSWIDDIAATDACNLGRAQQLVYGLAALMSVHMWKEDELYIAALESPSWPTVAGDRDERSAPLRLAARSGATVWP